MTRDAIERALDALQLTGENLVVHASLSALGLERQNAPWFCDVLIQRLGHDGTMLMPSFTYEETLLGGDREAVAFHPDLPVSAGVGAIAETFRKLPSVLRSNHPSHSFAAHGPQGRAVLSTQRDNNPLGPIKKLNVMRGHVVLIGTPLSACSAIHLAEETAAYPYLGRATALRINAAGYEERVVVERVPGCSRAFDRLDEQIDPTHVVSVDATPKPLRKIPVRYLVRLASAALARQPGFLICGDTECMSCARKRSVIDANAAAPLRPAG